MLDSNLLQLNFQQGEFPVGNHSLQALGNNQPICSLGKLQPEKLGSSSHDVVRGSDFLCSACGLHYITFYIGPAAERRKEPSQIPGQALINSGEWCVKVCAWKQCVEFHSISFFKHIGLGKYSTPRLRDSASLPLG